MNNSMTYGNLALKSYTTHPSFQVIDGNSRSFNHTCAFTQKAPVANARPKAGLFFVVVIAMIALSFTFLTSAASQRAFDTASANASRAVISVQSGDTLWDIAEEHPVSHLSTSDTVALIRSWNGLTSSELSIGMDLLVPASFQ